MTGPRSPRSPNSADNICLLLDDDDIFRNRLAMALGARGFQVARAATLPAARALIAELHPAFAIIDLNLPDGSGIDIVEAAYTTRPDCRAVLLTGYGSLPSAVAAMKHGAQDVLAKPADIDDIVDSLLTDRGARPPPPVSPASPDDVRWEHIKSIFDRSGQNVSKTARQLNMHRRTLQRILERRQDPVEDKGTDAI